MAKYAQGPDYHEVLWRKLDLLLASGELDFAIGDPSSITGNPVMQWRTRPAWFASAELSIEPFQILPLVLWQSSSSWHDGVLDALRRTGWEWRVVFESASLDASLAALDVDYVDILFVHGPRPGDTIANGELREFFEQAHRQGKIRAWGVSNFNVGDMEELFRIPQGDHCATSTPCAKLGVVVRGAVVKSLKTAPLGRGDHYAIFSSRVA